MPTQPEVFVQELERASDEAESALVRALIVYAAINDGEEEEEDEGLLVAFLRSSIAGFVAAVIVLTERYTNMAALSSGERDRITAEAIIIARDALRKAVSADPAMLSGDGDVSRTQRLADVAASAITAVRSEVQVEMAGPSGFTNKTWVTRRDRLVRASHQELDGVTIPLDDSFKTATYTIRFPGDRSAPPQAWINCRCVLRLSM